jgi:hypothetical protein
LEKVKEGEDRLPHILVIGLGHMGRSLVLHAARDWWAARKGSGQELQEEIKDYDRNTVRELPALLAKAGLQIERK